MDTTGKGRILQFRGQELSDVDGEKIGSIEEIYLDAETEAPENAGDAMDGPAISEEEHEVVLYEEQVVVDKRAVPKERVRLDKDTVTDQREVSEGVRTEQVELIDADGEPAEGLDGTRDTDEGLNR